MTTKGYFAFSPTNKPERHEMEFRYPERCPYCDYAVDKKDESGYCTFFDPENGVVLLRFTCPRRDCDKKFAVLYRVGQCSYDSRKMVSWWKGEIVCFVPALMSPRKRIPPVILEHIPAFKEALRQAEAVEALDYSHAVGPTYRRALEILLYEYILLASPERKEELESAKTLGECINRLIESEVIQNLSTVCAWAGNGLTHVRPDESGLGLSDLKDLLEAIMFFIAQHLTARDAGIRRERAAADRKAKKAQLQPAQARNQVDPPESPQTPATE